MTAVQQMLKELQENFPKQMADMYDSNQLLLEDIALKAKAMEKEQQKQLVIGTYIDLKITSPTKRYGMEYLGERAELERDAEQYYNETFKSE